MNVRTHAPTSPPRQRKELVSRVSWLICQNSASRCPVPHVISVPCQFLRDWRPAQEAMKTWWLQYSASRQCSPPRVNSAPAPCSATSLQIPNTADPVFSNQHCQHYLYIMSSASRYKYSTVALAFAFL